MEKTEKKVIVRLQEAGKDVTLTFEGKLTVREAIEMIANELGISLNKSSVIAINGNVVEETNIVKENDYITTTKGSTKSA
jgi:hypothetical protein